MRAFLADDPLKGRPYMYPSADECNRTQQDDPAGFAAGKFMIQLAFGIGLVVALASFHRLALHFGFEEAEEEEEEEGQQEQDETSAQAEASKADEGQANKMEMNPARDPDPEANIRREVLSI